MGNACAGSKSQTASEAQKSENLPNKRCHISIENEDTKTDQKMGDCKDSDNR